MDTDVKVIILLILMLQTIWFGASMSGMLNQVSLTLLLSLNKNCAHPIFLLGLHCPVRHTMSCTSHSFISS